MRLGIAAPCALNRSQALELEVAAKRLTHDLALGLPLAAGERLGLRDEGIGDGYRHKSKLGAQSVVDDCVSRPETAVLDELCEALVGRDERRNGFRHRGVAAPPLSREGNNSVAIGRGATEPHRGYRCRDTPT